MSDHIPDQLRGRGLEIHQAGRWWIVALEDPSIAMQGESRDEALDKLVKRLEEYQGRQERQEELTEAIRIPDIEDPRDSYRPMDVDRYFRDE